MEDSRDGETESRCSREESKLHLRIWCLFRWMYFNAEGAVLMLRVHLIGLSFDDETIFNICF